MLSIDEAITNETEMAEGLREQYECMMECSEIFREQKKVFIEQCKYDAEYHEQLAAWLEELKAIKDGSIPIIHGKAELELHDKAIRNEAIDDFIHECDKHCEFYSGKNKSITREDVLKIAENLKERRRMTESEAIELIENDLKLHSKDLSNKYKNGLRMAINALEKQIPKKPDCIEDKMWCCPVCDNHLLHKWVKYPTELMPKTEGLPHCMSCGQKIDWSDEE